jgi:hypothetical protein
LEEFEHWNSIDIIWVMECSSRGIRFHIVVGGKRIQRNQPWLRRWEDLGGIGTLLTYQRKEDVISYFAAKWKSDSAFDSQDCFGGAGWYVPDYVLCRIKVRGCCIGAQRECQLWSRKR